MQQRQSNGAVPRAAAKTKEDSPGVRAPRLDGDGLGDDGDVGNILMPLLTSMGVPPKRLGLIRNCRLLSSSR